MNKLILSVSLILFLTGCTTHEAAVIGAIPGRMIGMPLGVLATAIDESVKTAGDVVDANPRYSRVKNNTISKPAYQYQNYKPSAPAYHVAGNTHYYKAEVLIKTRGPAQLESMQLVDSRDVTEFWQ